MNNIIEKILNDFANKGIVFSNEQDFQFQMALELKLGNHGVKDIKLETISLEQDWNSVKNVVKNKGKINRQTKQYHDILVELANGEYALIELKYKTPSKLCLYKTQQGETITFVQGAYDIGAYDFIKDISRLETISYRHMFNDIQGKIKKSYAVILTNDKNYRFNNFKSKNKKGTQSPWINYSIEDGKKFSSGEIKFLINGNESSSYCTNKRKFESIKLKNNYGPFVWYDYKLNGYKNYQDEKVNGKSCICPGFSYLIVEVK